jgi:hypothetical protein
MGTKFNKYWEEAKLNDALVIATVLDPTKKVDYPDFFYEKYCANVDDIERNIEYIRDTMRLYFKKYEESEKEVASSCLHLAKLGFIKVHLSLEKGSSMSSLPGTKQGGEHISNQSLS